MSNRDAAPKALILGCAGPVLSPAEREFFRSADPAGFILFQRNCVDPAQLAALVADLKSASGRADTPVLIDQEGGRVQRLKPPHWRAAPSAGRIAQLPPAAAERAAWINARLIAADLAALGVTVDCMPVLDLPVPGAHEVIGNRALGTEPEQVVRLGRAVMRGLEAGGVLPVIKHLPGHGRALVDSHEHCPVVDAPEAALLARDVSPFEALADAPFAMTAHVVYTAWDPDRPATLSAKIIGEIIRGRIGFTGTLISDDLSMKALGGTLPERALGALAAGCDLALHCNGNLDEMIALAAAVGPLSAAGTERFARALAHRRAPEPADASALLAELDALMAAEVAA
ncbi:MAG: beta-N-acetylhexosaminidase [Aliidongia sp.]